MLKKEKFFFLKFFWWILFLGVSGCFLCLGFSNLVLNEWLKIKIFLFYCFNIISLLINGL